MKAGAVAVPLPPGRRSDRLVGAIADCAASACVLDRVSAREPAVVAACEDARLVLVHQGAGGGREPGAPWPDLGDALAASIDSEPDVRQIDVDLAAIIYTSGSTGAPRGVMLSHLNIVSNTESIVAYLRLGEADRVMCVLPFYYVYGLSLLHTHMRVGGSLVIDNRFAFPNAVLQAMQEHHVTGFAGVPSTFALLMHRSAMARTALPSLRYVTQAGGAMAPAQIREWQEKLPGVPFFVMYGATEASARLTYLEPDQLGGRLGSIGRAIPNVELRVVTDDGRVAAPGEVGELVARGSCLSSGYWNNDRETRERFGPLGYRTGDLGYADEDGFLFLVGRRHDMLKIGAQRVGAKEIEDVIYEHPSVYEAAVVAEPHELLGEVPVAFVVPRDEARWNEADLAGFCHTRLAAFKVPVRFLVRKELPKSAIGKLDKPALRAEIARELALPRSQAPARLEGWHEIPGTPA
jgi:acyl-CoA synthetase (AMP-forming)/AMP-acid ligase II